MWEERTTEVGWKVYGLWSVQDQEGTGGTCKRYQAIGGDRHMKERIRGHMGKGLSTKAMRGQRWLHITSLTFQLLLVGKTYGGYSQNGVELLIYSFQIKRIRKAKDLALSGSEM